MISLRKSVSALEELEQLNRCLQGSYRATLQDLQESAIPLRNEPTRQFRETLKAIEGRLESASTPGEVEKVRSVLRDELLQYQQQGTVMIEGLRESVSTISRVLEEVTSSLNEDASAQTDAISSHLARLQALAAADDLQEIQSGLKTAIAGIANSVDVLRRQNRMIVAQFREEIRTLHAQLRASQSAAKNQPALNSGGAVAALPAAQQASSGRAPEAATFSLLAIWIKNWRLSLHSASPAVKAAAFESFTESLGDALGYRPVVNRFQDDVLMTRLNAAQSDAIRISKDLSSATWPEFSTGDDRRPVQWRVVTGIVSCRAGESTETLMGRFEKLVDMLKRSA